ncbi:MAG: protein kinase [Deltaproteobacteria bacterium]|nr:protein kinase [Deltaproteobacteria bacterium]
MEKISNYKIVRRIGQGGMAEVYLAQADYNGLKKTVALKKILDALSQKPHFRETFRYEASLSMELNHPNMVQVFDYGQTNDSRHLFMAMEFVDGTDLMKLIRRAKELQRPIPGGISAYVISEVLKGLDYAHRLVGSDGKPLKLVHRDMSPQNILLSYEGGVKVTDFGIAKALGKDEEQGVLRGKFHYMSPEQAHAEEVDARSDIFSVGLILYEMITGINPYSQFKGPKALEAARKAEIQPPSLVCEVSVELEQIIRKALAPKREDRYQRSREMQQDLSQYLHQLSLLYDSSSLMSFTEEIFPESERIGLNTAVDSSLQTEEKTGKGEGLGFTVETITEGGRFKETKKLVSMVVNVLGTQEAANLMGRERVDNLIDRFIDMVQNILLKDRQHRYRFKRLEKNSLLVVRGIPYTGEYDETELLRDAHKIRRDFATYKEIIPALDIGIGVYRSVVDLIHEREKVSWELGNEDLRQATLLSRFAPGEVVVSQFIHAAAKYNWILEQIDESFGSPVYKLVRQKDKTARIMSRVGGHIFGRSFELDSIRKLYDKVFTTSRMHNIVVIGDMGLGKTSLIQTFLNDVKKSAIIIRAEARPYYSYTPFALIVSILKDIIRINTSISEGDDYLKLLSVYLETILPSEETRNDVISSLGPILTTSDMEPESDDLKSLVIKSLETILKGIALQTPVILVIEDLQWSDTQSRNVLKAIIERDSINRKLLMLMSCREKENLDDTFYKFHPILLTNLDLETSRILVENRFVAPDTVQVLTDIIVKQGEGNPFFLNELVTSLHDMGIVSPSDSDTSKLVLAKPLTEDFHMEMSPTLEGIISSRLDALEPQLRRVLRLAAVAGRTFTRKLLDTLAGISTENQISIFLEKKFIKKMDESDRYSFIQQIMRDYAYEGIPEDEKRSAHLSVAKFMVESPSYNATREDAIIAYHYESGGDKSNASVYYLAAAHHARKLASNQEAERHYRKVLSNLSNTNEPALKATVFHAHKDLEMVYRNIGQRDFQMSEIRAMETLADEERNREWKSTALCRRLGYYQEIGDLKKTLEIFNESYSLAREVNDYYSMVDSLRILARAKIELGEIYTALEVIDQALDIVSKHKEISSIEADLFHIRGNAQFYIGNIDEALKTYSRAIELFRKEKRRTQEATILMNQGFLAAHQGRFEDALFYYKQAYQIDVEKGDRVHTGVKLSNLAQVHIELGNFGQAAKILKQARKLCEQTRDNSALSDSILTIAQLKIRTSKYAEAMAYISEGISLASESLIDEIRGRRLWAVCQIEDPEGSYMEALGQTDKVVELSKKAAVPDELILGLSYKALALLKLEQAKDAAIHSNKAVSYSVVVPVPNLEIIYWIHGMVMNALNEKFWAMKYLGKAKDEVLRKAKGLSQEKAREIYLSVNPAKEIIDTYNRFEDKKHH